MDELCEAYGEYVGRSASKQSIRAGIQRLNTHLDSSDSRSRLFNPGTRRGYTILFDGETCNEFSAGRVEYTRKN